jgi:hypothetical protein
MARQSDVIARILGVDKGEIPLMGNTPRYLVIRGKTSVGETQVLIGLEAARDLQGRLTEILPVDDPEFQP